MSEETMKVTFEESPYGDKGVTYTGCLGMFQHYVLQLKSFRSPTKTKEQSDYLENDIKGYEEVLRSNSETNARNFLAVKNDSRLPFATKTFKNNIEIVEHLKATGLWETPPTMNQDGE